jgi:uncharacterized protein YndB with AHSA1/START domain
MNPAAVAGELGTFKRGYCVAYHRTSKHPPGRLWRAITDSGEVTRWMAYPVEIDLRVGGAYHADFSRTDGGQLDGVIVKVEPLRLLRYAWGTSTVEWLIEPEGEGSRYVFAQHGLYPRGLPGEEGIAAGWHVWLEDLEQYLDTGRPSSEAEGAERWAAIGKLYWPNLAAVVSMV